MRLLRIEIIAELCRYSCRLRGVAVAMGDWPAAGLDLINGILERGDLADYHLLHAARADLYRRLDRNDEARVAYGQALVLAKQEPERKFLQLRLEGLE